MRKRHWLGLSNLDFAPIIQELPCLILFVTVAAKSRCFCYISAATGMVSQADSSSIERIFRYLITLLKLEWFVVGIAAGRAGGAVHHKADIRE